MYVYNPLNPDTGIDISRLLFFESYAIMNDNKKRWSPLVAGAAAGMTESFITYVSWEDVLD
jgi:hypothetical protein